MRILYFHQYFSTLNGSNGTRSYEFASALVKNGFSVTVVCLKTDRSNTGLIGKVKNGYRRGLVEGIEIIEFDIPYSNNLSFLKRGLIFIKFILRSSSLVFKEKVDLIFATSTPLTISLPGILGKWFKGIPFVFEVRDLWPELPKSMGIIKNPLLLLMLSLLEWLSYKSADTCIGLAPGICEEISKKIDINKVTFIPNASDLDIFYPLKNSTKFIPKILNGIQIKESNNIKFLAAFTGAHGIANGLDSVLDAAKKLLEIGRDDIHIILIGDGSCKKELENRAKEQNLYNCHFVSSVSKIELAKILRENVNCGLMILKDIPAFYRGTSPNKFFDYLSSGLPILINYPGWISEIILAKNAGIQITPNNPEQFVEALIYLSDNKEIRENMSINSRKIAEQDFSRQEASQKFLATIKNTFYKNEYRKLNYHKIFSYLTFKLFCDKILATILLVLFFPLLLIIALIIKIKLGNPIIFSQIRPGYKCRTFKLLKFRSMLDIRDQNGHLLEDNSRNTNIGLFLRKTSLDELPGLINILKGDMSFIGPRPLLVEYLEHYNDEEIKRHDCYPGFSGWAQIKGRNSLTWEEKFKLDVWYTKHINFFLDLYIFFITIKKVLFQEGITPKNESQMPLFKGNNK